MRASKLLCIAAVASGCFPDDFKFCLFEPKVCQGDSVLGTCSGTLTNCDSDEVCVDTDLFGNPHSGNAFCTPHCGDGVIGGFNENCETNYGLFSVGGEGCDPTSCQVETTPSCGNGLPEPGELCFTPLAQTTQTTDPFVDLVDVDGDADLDLFMETSVSLNDGAGVFGAPVSHGLPTNPIQLQFADLDEDGRTDVIALQPSQVTLAFQRPDGFTETQVLPLGVSVFQVEVGDLEGDLRQDIIVRGVDQLIVFPSQGAGVFLPPVILAAPTIGEMQIADLDGDLDDDVLSLDAAQGVQQFSLQPDGSLLQVSFTELDAFSLEELFVHDTNGDSIPELIGLGGSSIFVLQQQNGSFLLSQENSQNVSTQLLVEDFNNDGAVDLAMIGDVTAIYPNLGGLFGAPQFTSTLRFQHLAGDVNGDSFADLVFTPFGEIAVSLGGAK